MGPTSQLFVLERFRSLKKPDNDISNTNRILLFKIVNTKIKPLNYFILENS